MYIAHGKRVIAIDAATLACRIAGYRNVVIDIGTGDGRFVQHIAAESPTTFVIGIDACADQVCKTPRRAQLNTMYMIANAERLPCELYGLAAHISVHFPWGSLLEGLLTNESAVAQNLAALAQPGAQLDIHLNAGALAECGWTLEEGGKQVRQVIKDIGFTIRSTQPLGPRELRGFPTTWAKRLAFGRDPRALSLKGVHLDLSRATTRYTEALETT